MYRYVESSSCREILTWIWWGWIVEIIVLQIFHPLVSNTKGFIEECVRILDHNEACLPCSSQYFCRKSFTFSKLFLQKLQNVWNNSVYNLRKWFIIKTPTLSSSNFLFYHIFNYIATITHFSESDETKNNYIRLIKLTRTYNAQDELP